MSSTSMPIQENVIDVYNSSSSSILRTESPYIGETSTTIASPSYIMDGNLDGPQLHTKKLPPELPHFDFLNMKGELGFEEIKGHHIEYEIPPSGTVAEALEAALLAMEIAAEEENASLENDSQVKPTMEEFGQSPSIDDFYSVAHSQSDLDSPILNSLDDTQVQFQVHENYADDNKIQSENLPDNRRKLISSGSDITHMSTSSSSPPTSIEAENTQKYNQDSNDQEQDEHIIQDDEIHDEIQLDSNSCKLSSFETALLFNTTSLISRILPHLSWADFRSLLNLSRTISMCLHSQKHLVFSEFLENYSEKTHHALELSFTDVDQYHMTRSLTPHDYTVIVKQARKEFGSNDEDISTIQHCLCGYNRVVLKCRNAFKAPLLRIFLVTEEEGWHSDTELENIETILKEDDFSEYNGKDVSGITKFMKVGDLVQNLAMNPYTTKRPIVERGSGEHIIGPNDGKLIWDGTFLRDLDFHPTLPWGHLPSWLDALKHPPGYWHPNVVAAAPPGAPEGTPVSMLMTLDFSPYINELQQTLRLEKKAYRKSYADEMSSMISIDSSDSENFQKKAKVTSTRPYSIHPRSVSSPDSSSTSSRRIVHQYTYRANCVVSPWGEYVLEAPGTVEGARDLIAYAAKEGGHIWRMCRERTRWGLSVVELWDWPEEKQRTPMSVNSNGRRLTVPQPLATQEHVQIYEEQRETMLMLDEQFAKLSNYGPQIKMSKMTSMPHMLSRSNPHGQPIPRIPDIHRQSSIPAKAPPAHRPMTVVMPTPLSIQQAAQLPIPPPTPLSGRIPSPPIAMNRRSKSFNPKRTSTWTEPLPPPPQFNLSQTTSIYHQYGQPPYSPHPGIQKRNVLRRGQTLQHQHPFPGQTLQHQHPFPGQTVQHQHPFPGQTVQHPFPGQTVQRFLPPPTPNSIQSDMNKPISIYPTHEHDNNNSQMSRTSVYMNPNMSSHYHSNGSPSYYNVDKTPHQLAVDDLVDFPERSRAIAAKAIAMLEDDEIEEIVHTPITNHIHRGHNNLGYYGENTMIADRRQPSKENRKNGGKFSRFF